MDHRNLIIPTLTAVPGTPIEMVTLGSVFLGTIEPSGGEWITRGTGGISEGLRWFTKIGALRYLKSAYEAEHDDEIIHWEIDL